MFLAVVTLQLSTATFFRGFLIQPRLAADDTTVVGSFAAPGAGGVYRLSSCTPAEVCTSSYQVEIQYDIAIFEKALGLAINNHYALINEDGGVSCIGSYNIMHII